MIDLRPPRSLRGGRFCRATFINSVWSAARCGPSLACAFAQLCLALQKNASMKRSVWLAATLLSLLGTGLASTVRAGDFGAIVGLVTDASGAPVAHATITAVRADGGATRAPLSGSDGVYSFGDLSPGQLVGQRAAARAYENQRPAASGAGGRGDARGCGAERRARCAARAAAAAFPGRTCHTRSPRRRGCAGPGRAASGGAAGAGAGGRHADAFRLR